MNAHNRKPVGLVKIGSPVHIITRPLVNDCLVHGTLSRLAYNTEYRQVLRRAQWIATARRVALLHNQIARARTIVWVEKVGVARRLNKAMVGFSKHTFRLTKID